MKCLVTGAAGFIGSHLTEKLLDSGHSVRAVDRLSPYYPAAVKLQNLREVEARGPLEFVKADLATADLANLVEDIELVFHLAAQPGVRASWGPSFATYLSDNVLSTQRLLEATRNTIVQRFVVASSSSVYGNAMSFPVMESEDFRPRSPYGMTKAAVELLCQAFYREYDAPVVLLRYFTVFGPRQRPDMAFHRFINQALQNKTLGVFGDGTQSRDFTFVSDAVDATIAAGLRGDPGAAYNIAGGTHASVSEAIEVIAATLGRELDVDLGAPQAGDVKSTDASTELASLDLGYRPQIDLHEGLGRQIGWQQAKFSNLEGDGARVETDV